MFSVLDISTSGMRVQRVRMNTIASNLANMNTTRDEFGRVNPYRRLLTTFEAGAAGRGTPGVRVSKIHADQGPLRRAFEPGHPDADADGFVFYPNVDMIVESVDAIDAGRAFEANVAAFEATKSMIGSAMRILA